MFDSSDSFVTVTTGGALGTAVFTIDGTAYTSSGSTFTVWLYGNSEWTFPAGTYTQNDKFQGTAWGAVTHTVGSGGPMPRHSRNGIISNP